MLSSILKTMLKRDEAGQAQAPAKPSSFLPTYEERYAPHLLGRTDGFRIMFRELEARLARRPGPALIVETGSLRTPGEWLDGQSTLLWAEFAKVHPCEIHTVDLNPDAAVTVRQTCGDAVHAHTGDSVAFLHRMACAPQPRQIDLLYLDSFDLDKEDPFPSAFHHMKELTSARPCIGPGTIIAVDDNLVLPDGQYGGKGYLVMQWFRHLEIECLHSGYQWIWRF
ncbi:MAG TPA: class I SAM-dependent methyltransferase [Burkholderiales bacterium]|jgi:hypothetical protein